jgi:dihydroorotase
MIHSKEPPFDLVLRGGHVIDPQNGIDGPRDVAIRRATIAAVAPDLGNVKAKQTLSVAGLYVTPGLIDLHVHVFGYVGSLPPDSDALSDGVTTVVDAGGSGWKTFPEFKEKVINRSRTRVLAFLNIVGAGMVGAAEQEVGEMDAVAAAEMIHHHPDLLVGVKTAHFGGEGWEAVDRAVKAGQLSGTPAMIDFAPRPTRSYRDLLLHHLRPGDIHTHVYAPHIPLLDEDQRVCDYVWEARERGVLFDVGHGQISLAFRHAIPALEQGFLPDTLSTDRHRDSALQVEATMTATLSKFLNMGLPLAEAIRLATVRPAQVIHRPDLGTLSPGAEADVAVLELLHGDFGFVDGTRSRLRGDRRLQCVLTLRRGEVVWDRNGLSCPDWKAGSGKARMG